MSSVTTNSGTVIAPRSFIHLVETFALVGIGIGSTGAVAITIPANGQENFRWRVATSNQLTQENMDAINNGN